MYREEVTMVKRPDITTLRVEETLFQTTRFPEIRKAVGRSVGRLASLNRQGGETPLPLLAVARTPASLPSPPLRYIT